MNNAKNDNIEKMAEAASEAMEEKWLAESPRLYVQGELYVEAWWAKEIFTRLSMILFILRNFAPGDVPDGFNAYRAGLINIALTGDPKLHKQAPASPNHD